MKERPFCEYSCPPTWTGHWRDWHRGHGCHLDPTPDAPPADPASPASARSGARQVAWKKDETGEWHLHEDSREWCQCKPQPTRHWGVSVDRNGEDVLRIESACLSGRDLSPEDERVIRIAAEHLRSFVGPDPDVEVQSSSPAAGREEAVPPLETRVGLAAVAYMRDCMGMRESDSDQDQNFILGHLHTFALQQIEAEAPGAAPAPPADELDALRTLRSIAAMLGWMNLPPQHIFEAEIRALKARAASTGKASDE